MQECWLLIFSEAIINYKRSPNFLSKWYFWVEHGAASMNKILVIMWSFVVALLLPPVFNDLFNIKIFHEGITKNYALDSMWFMIFAYMITLVYVNFDRKDDQTLSICAGVFIGLGMYSFFAVASGIGSIMLVSASLLINEVKKKV